MKQEKVRINFRQSGKKSNRARFFFYYGAGYSGVA